MASRNTWEAATAGVRPRHGLYTLERLDKAVKAFKAGSREEALGVKQLRDELAPILAGMMYYIKQSEHGVNEVSLSFREDAVQEMASETSLGSDPRFRSDFQGGAMFDRHIERLRGGGSA